MTVAKMTARHRHIRRGAGSVILDIIIYAVMILVLLACLVPFIYMLALSFSDSKAISGVRPSLPRWSSSACSSPAA